jgi:hypothetical protein
VPRALARVPADTLIVTAALWRRLVRRSPVGGTVRAIRFRSGGDERRSTGCRLLATGLDSLGPNSYVIGIDPERELMLVHQLVPRDDPASADPMELRAALPRRRSTPERGERR